MALRLVQVCHYETTDEMLRQIHSLYVAWNNSPNVGHFSIYWDMRQKKIICLNGSNGPQLEFLDAVGNSNDTVTGFGWKPSIRSCAEHCTTSGTQFTTELLIKDYDCFPLITCLVILTYSILSYND